MARRCTARQWDGIVRDVLTAAALPHDFHVDVKRIRGLDALGYAEALDLDTGRFRVEVNEDLSRDHAPEILIHELAHVLDWRPATPFTCNHGPTFWIYFGEIWRRYHQVM